MIGDVANTLEGSTLSGHAEIVSAITAALYMHFRPNLPGPLEILEMMTGGRRPFVAHVTTDQGVCVELHYESRVVRYDETAIASAVAELNQPVVRH